MNTQSYAEAIKFQVTNCPLRALLVFGGTGLGKSEIPSQVAADLKLPIVYFDCTAAEPTDLLGLPDKDGGSTKYKPPDELMPVMTQPKGIFVLEEVSRLDLQVRHAIMPMLARRVIGGIKFNPGWLIVATANPADEGYQVNELDIALTRRMIVLSLEFDTNLWQKWAVNHNFSPRVVTAVPRVGGSMNKVINRPIEQVPNPYGMEMASDLIKAGVDQLDKDLAAAMLAGCVGNDAALAILSELNNSKLDALIKIVLEKGKIGEPPHDLLTRLVYEFWSRIKDSLKQHRDHFTNLYLQLPHEMRVVLMNLAYETLVEGAEDFKDVMDEWAKWCTDQLLAIQKLKANKKKGL